MASGASPVMGRPSKTTSPSRRTSPQTALSRVVLPAPLEPMRETISPARTWQVTPLRAVTEP